MLPEITTARVVADSKDRETWLAARRDYIGASEVAVVLGLTGSATELYARKLGLMPDFEGNERTRWGLRLEEAILEGVADERGLGETAVRDGRMLVSLDHPHMSATPDGWLTLGAEALLTEIKNTAAWTELPPHIWTQAQAQMLVLGQERALVAALCFGSRYVGFEVERDGAFLRDAAAACREFRDRIENQDPPPPDGSDATRKALASMYPADTGEAVELPAELVEQLAQREVFRASIKANEAEVGEIENRVRAHIGPASLASGCGWKATHKAQSRKASVCPACAHEITPASTYRVLRITPPKEG